MTFSNPSNWSSINSGNIIASTFTTPEGKTIYIPIVKQEIPVLVESSAIAVYTSTPNPKSTWKNGGFMGVNIFTGLGKGGSSSEIVRTYLALDKVTIIIIPSYALNKSLSLYVPRWFRGIFWEVWEYVGALPQDNIGKLDKIIDILEV